MYAVTGAAGQFGRLVIASLLRRVGAGEIIALARDPAKAVDLEQLGITVRPFDYDKPAGLGASLEGVTRLLLVSSDMPDRRVGQHKAVIDAAVAVAVDVIAYTSIIHADTNPISLAESHRETERMIAVSGLSHAILRNSWYIENYPIGADAAIAQGALLGSSGTGMISAATRADYADAAAAVLTQEPVDNPVYELAGDEAFTLYDVANVLSEVAGRTVVYRDLPEPAYRTALIDAGMPAGLAAALAEYSAKAAGDILADRSRTLSRLIGRPSETMRDTVLRTLVRPATADNT
jgi:NAD(P)H dehydrogenase (quinone)